MNSQASNPATGTAADTPPKPLYQLTYLIAMLEREEQAKQARQHREGKRR